MADRTRTRGMTLVETLLGAALIGLFFFGIIGAFQLALKTIGYARAEAGAVALANERMEYLRSLPYNDIGTQGGIPSGTVAQNEDVALNGVTYGRRTLVQYVDAPEDGEGDADENGITADYKRAKVEITWSARGEEKSLSFITNLVPQGIETLEDGGTLRVNVFDASAAPVASAEVHVVNTSISPAIDVTVYTNASGTAMFPGAPVGGGYEVSATKAGYSTDQTYSATAENPNPNPPHASVIEGAVSTLNFAIDRTSTIEVRTVGPAADETDEDTFADTNSIATLSNTEVLSDWLVLTATESVYASEGTMLTETIAPPSLVAWREASWSAFVSGNTGLAARIYAVDESGTATLVPDLVLPGNAAGFTTSPIALTSLTAALYPRLALELTLRSFDGITTPEVESRAISYSVAAGPIPRVAYTLEGAKNIGTNGSGVPLKKYAGTLETNGSGVSVIEGLEWDVYDVVIDGAVEGYDISDACEGVPISLAPDSEVTSTLLLVSHTARSLLVHVKTAVGTPIAGATVVLSGDTNETGETSACGYAHFTGLPASSGYSVEVSAPGYTTETIDSIVVDGTESLSVILLGS